MTGESKEDLSSFLNIFSFVSLAVTVTVIFGVPMTGEHTSVCNSKTTPK
jgi:hypothetical protein